MKQSSEKQHSVRIQDDADSVEAEVVVNYPQTDFEMTREIEGPKLDQ